jgi:hypothetical protein
VPRQRSSGGKIRLVGIGKRAHRYSAAFGELSSAAGQLLFR